MTIKEIHYHHGQKIKILSRFDQYEMTEINFSAEATVEDGEDIHLAYVELKEIVDKEIELQILMLKEPSKVAYHGSKLLIEKNKLI